MSETAAAATPMADHIEQFWRYLERERVRILVDLHRDGYCDSSSFNDEFAKALLAERTAAQKKIAELEAELKTNKLALEMCSNECNKLCERLDKRSNALTAERQRRESAETELRKVRGNLVPGDWRIADIDAYSASLNASDSEERKLSHEV